MRAAIQLHWRPLAALVGGAIVIIASRYVDAGAVFMLAIVAGLAWMGAENYADERNGDWHPCSEVSSKLCIDGQRRGGHLMRRWTGSDWQYREETDEEVYERWEKMI